MNWLVTHCDTATANDGTVYTVRMMSFGVKNRYLAVRSWMDETGGKPRLWESTVGVFDTRLAAKTACEDDAKS